MKKLRTHTNKTETIECHMKASPSYEQKQFHPEYLAKHMFSMLRQMNNESVMNKSLAAVCDSL